MRAILIDPEKRTFTEVQIGKDIDQIRTLLKCESFTGSGRALNGSLSKGFDAILVSDDYLEDREADELRFWFQVDADRNPPSSYPIAGLGLAHGVDEEGETCDLRISAEELAKRITFTRRKFRGFETFTGDAARARGADLVVEIKAPIIDGERES
jgi:hypothetical protein